MVEYWAHEAALIPVEHWPLFRHRMEKNWHWPSMDRWMVDNPGVIEQVLAEVAERGPLRPETSRTTRMHRGVPGGTGPMPSSPSRRCFSLADLTVAQRVNFIRHYDLAERVLPPEILGAEVDEVTARRRLLQQAVRHHGIGTAADLADYYRMNKKSVEPLLTEMAADGDGQRSRWPDGRVRSTWTRAPGYRARSTGLAVLCPFDPVIWFRPRTERLFDFHYRVEIYTPPPKRVFGYYVFPILLDGELVGRVDLKADRQAGLLRVQGSYVEEGQDPDRVAPTPRRGDEDDGRSGWASGTWRWRERETWPAALWRRRSGRPSGEIWSLTPARSEKRSLSCRYSHLSDRITWGTAASDRITCGDGLSRSRSLRPRPGGNRPAWR